jgi:hypothetical protein
MHLSVIVIRRSGQSDIHGKEWFLARVVTMAFWESNFPLDYQNTRQIAGSKHQQSHQPSAVAEELSRISKTYCSSTRYTEISATTGN